MDYFARRNLYNNNRTPPILLNKESLNPRFSNNNISQIIPSYSGNPHILRNYKTNIYYSNNNNYSTNKSLQMNTGEVINSRYKNRNINDNIRNINNYNKYQRYIPSSNYNNNKSNNFNDYNTNYSSSNKLSQNDNPNQKFQPPNLRSKILNLSNNPQRKELAKNLSMAYLPIRNKNRFHYISTKKKLILDLDETLVHSGFNPFTRQSDISIQINIDGKMHTINILKRPHVDEFLKEISNYFDIYVFTASMEEYASPVIDLIDKNNLVKGKFFRQDCIFNNGLYIKDLFKVTKDLKDVIIIDNNPSSYMNNEDNGIPIKTWYDDLNDNELIKLIPILKHLSGINDVRSIIRQIVNRRSNEVDFNVVNKIINGKVENKNYENNFYHEINESKIKDKERYNNNNDNYYSRFDRYKKYNNINSFSNMSYNEIQNEEGHLKINNNYNHNIKKYYNNNEEVKYNQRNSNENIDVYQYRDRFSDNDKSYNNLFKTSYNGFGNRENNYSYNQYMNNNIHSQNLVYQEKIRNNRAFTPNINRRKNSFYFNEKNNYENHYIATNGNNNINEENNKKENNINNYYEKRQYNQKFDESMYNNLYNNHDLKINTQNILNRSSSDIYPNNKRSDIDLNKYNYLININEKDNNDNRRETETNETNKDYYLQSYKNHLSRTNYRTKDYVKNNYNNNTNSVIKPSNNNIRINNSTNFQNINRPKHYLDYFTNKSTNINNNINMNKREEKYERKNYNISDLNKTINNKRDYLDEVNRIKNQINERYNHFHDYIRDKKKEITHEENKSRNFEEPDKLGIRKIESYYLIRNNIRNGDYANYNYLERNNLQNLIDKYKSRFNALENSINNNRIKLNKSFSMNKKYIN